MRITLSLLACLIGFYGLFGAYNTMTPIALATQERITGLTVYRYDLQGHVNMILEASQGLLSQHHTHLELQSPILHLQTAKGHLQVAAATAHANDFHFPFAFSFLTLDKDLHMKLENQSSLTQVSANKGTWDVPKRELAIQGCVQGQHQGYALTAEGLSCTQTHNQLWEKIKAQAAKISSPTEGNFEAMADHMDFTPATGIVSLEGNVKLVQAQQEMVAEHLLFDLHSQTIRSAPGASGKSKLIILQ